MSLNLNAFINRHLRPTNLQSDKKVVCSPEELHELCQRSIVVLSNELVLVRSGVPCSVIGSLYGHFHDLVNTLNDIGLYTVGNKIMFLGNYVDYGSRSIETISLLLALKIQDPGRYFLLRGNHECADVNRKDGFFDELVGRFGADEGEKLFNHFNEVFSWMPLAGIISNRCFCVHGGISPRIRSFEDIEKIPRPLHDPLSNSLAIDLLWGEPDEKTVCYRPNPQRHNAMKFGFDLDLKFRMDFVFDMIVRGSDVALKRGFKRFGMAKVLSLFAASNFDGKNNEGCILAV